MWDQTSLWKGGKPHKKNNNLYRLKNEKGRKEGSYTPSTHKQKIQWKWNPHATQLDNSNRILFSSSSSCSPLFSLPLCVNVVASFQSRPVFPLCRHVTCWALITRKWAALVVTLGRNLTGERQAARAGEGLGKETAKGRNYAIYSTWRLFWGTLSSYFRQKYGRGPSVWKKTAKKHGAPRFAAFVSVRRDRWAAFSLFLV